MEMTRVRVNHQTAATLALQPLAKLGNRRTTTKNTGNALVLIGDRQNDFTPARPSHSTVI